MTLLTALASSSLLARLRRWLPGALRRRLLERAVADALPVLPVLTGQIRDASTQVETSVVDVCANFQAMATRARDTVSAITDATGQDRPLDEMREKAAATLQRMLERVVHSSELSMRAVYRIEDVEERTKDVESVLGEVERIASGTWILAVNASIEATRAGAQGVAFAVVADQIGEMARHSRATSERIREFIKAIQDDVTAVSQQLRMLASTDMAEALKSKTDVDDALAALTQANDDLRQRVDRASETSAHLARDIAGAVMAMQFQDAVHQRLQHVIEAIERIDGRLRGCVTGTPPVASANDGGESLQGQLQERYTMAAERRIEAAVTGSGMAAAAEAADGSIELF